MHDIICILIEYLNDDNVIELSVCCECLAYFLILIWSCYCQSILHVLVSCSELFSYPCRRPLFIFLFLVSTNFKLFEKIIDWWECTNLTGALSFDSWLDAHLAYLDRFSTGAVTPGSALIHEFYSREVNNPVHLTVDTEFRTGAAGIKAFVSISLSLGDHQLAAQFQEIPLDLRMLEAERIGCMYLSKLVPLMIFVLHTEACIFDSVKHWISMCMYAPDYVGDDFFSILWNWVNA